MKTNNVKRICNYFKVSRPMFVDKVTHGYRVRVSCLTDMTAEDAAAQISKDLGIECTYRLRSGYSRYRGGADLIIPFACDDEEVKYEY